MRIKYINLSESLVPCRRNPLRALLRWLSRLLWLPVRQNPRHDLSAFRGERERDRFAGRVSGCRRDKVAHGLDLEAA